ncbi:MAG: GNAT family N-acetyltransferase [Actinomycetota bacterium]
MGEFGMVMSGIVVGSLATLFLLHDLGPRRAAFAVRAVDAAATRPLRHEVLRPHQAVETIVYDAEDDPATLHLGAFVDGALVGIATIHPDGERTFRVRGMAVRDGSRGDGIGSALLDGLLAHADDRGATLVWCNARMTARRFYERRGFVAVSDEWEEPSMGPHVRMERRLG